MVIKIFQNLHFTRLGIKLFRMCLHYCPIRLADIFVIVVVVVVVVAVHRHRLNQKKRANSILCIQTRHLNFVSISFFAFPPRFLFIFIIYFCCYKVSFRMNQLKSHYICSNVNNCPRVPMCQTDPNETDLGAKSNIGQENLIRCIEVNHNSGCVPILCSI